MKMPNMENSAWFNLCRRHVFGLCAPMDPKDFRGKAVLHFSDTPSTFYRGMRQLIELFEPVCVVHTGDLADEIKLELRPGELPRYRKKLEELASAMSAVKRDKLVIVTGNHDHEESVRDFFPGVNVIADRGRIEMCGLDLNLSHSPEALLVPLSHYNMFGHTCPRGLVEGEGTRLLNGLNAVHALNVETGEVLLIPYPGYVNDARFNRKKIGL